MELAKRSALFDSPLHPYTRFLMSAVPLPNPRVERSKQRLILKGEPPSPAHPPTGCVFHPRCPIATELCKSEIPELKEYELGHFCRLSPYYLRYKI